MFRGFRYKLDPTPAQEQKFREFAGVCRFVYNLALEQREREWTHYRDNGVSLNFFQQSAELTQLRAEVDWIEAAPVSCETAALRDLDKAFANFFAGRARYPTPRRKGVHDSFQFKGREVPVKSLNAKWSTVKIPKVGWVKFRLTRPSRGTVKTATIRHNAFGWFISFDCEIEHQAEVSGLPSVGIDRGVANTLALSTGELLSLPSSLAAIDRKKRGAQRVLARRVKGSQHRKKALLRVSRLSASMARIRLDWQHRAALSIAQRFGTAVLEELRIANMTASGPGKRGLNRSILNQGWFAFEAILAYKLEERGGTLAKVPAPYTSQTCSCCGTIDRLSRESQARFVCRHCGFEAHADLNAATNILRRNTPSVEARGYPAREARTSGKQKLATNHLALAG